METEETKTPVQQEKPKSEQLIEQAAWYDFLINIFKKLLETSNFSYGTKKKF